jgi:hypothetical protein
MAASHSQHCTRHPATTAGWHCQSCGASLCLECIQVRRMHTVDLLTCVACQGEAAPILVHRSQSFPLAERLRHAWRFPFSRPNLLYVALLSALLALFGFLTDTSFMLLTWMPALLKAGLFWACFFAIVRTSARGEDEIQTPDITHAFSSLLLPGLRGIVATGVVWAPALVYLIVFRGWNLFGQLSALLLDPMFYIAHKMPSLPEGDVRLDPVFWLISFAGIFFLPVVLMRSAGGASFLEMLHPREWVKSIRRLGDDYALTLAALLVLGFVLLATRALGAELLALRIFLLSRWLTELSDTLVLFTMAHVLGLLLYTRGDAIGYGVPGDYLLPVAQAPATDMRRHLPVPAAPEPAQTSEPAAPASQLQELNAAMEARDVAKALLLYPALTLAPAAIPPALHLFVGQAAATKGDYALSVRALEAAADVAPEDPTAPRALVLLARVLGERLQEAHRAQDVYRYIVERYPETEASRFARSRLSPTS